MPKTNPAPQKSYVPILLSLSLAAFLSLHPTAAFARKPILHWEKIRLVHVQPSQVFTKLGLTHITKYGVARDGKTGEPDPAFPPGLTDVVPDDPDHLFLVHGTPEGLAQFRHRLLLADVLTPHFHLTVELQQSRDGQIETIATREISDLASDTPVSIALGEGQGLHVYQLGVRTNLDNSLSVSYQCGLPLSPNPPIAGRDAHAQNVQPPAQAVFIPSLIWTTPVSKPDVVGGIVLFDDRAADRLASRQRLGMAAADDAFAGDYIVHLTISAVAPSPVPTPESAPRQ